jgi:hypothetical protein
MYLVGLRQVPSLYIADTFARPDIETGEVAVKVGVRSVCTAAVKGTIAVSISLAAGGNVLQTAQRTAQFPPGDSENELTHTVAQPRLWNLDNPLHPFTGSFFWTAS